MFWPRVLLIRAMIIAKRGKCKRISHDNDLQFKFVCFFGIEKSINRPIISINIENGRERRFISIKTAAIELDINAAHISNICRKKSKTATSKKDKHKYTFRYLD